MLNRRPAYLFVFSIAINLLISSLTSKVLLAQSLLPGTDLGYGNMPQAFVDINGDSQVDYCRFVGDAPAIFIACILGTPNGFDYATQNTAFTSARGIDLGYSDRPKSFKDVNGDGKADYCRFIGNAPNIREACAIAGVGGFDPNQTQFLTGVTDPILALSSGTDVGYGILPRSFVDVNGDNRIDYCRFVGDAPAIFIACILGAPNGFNYATQNTAFTSVRGIDLGYSDRPREFKDINGDGKADYCRFIGDVPNIREACAIAGAGGFDPNQTQFLTGVKDPNTPVATLPTKIFPLRGSEFTELGDHRRMKTDVTISNNGRIDGVTRIWTAKQLQGFTGAAAVVLTDADGNILYVTEPHSYGVNCKRCPGPSDRTQGWTDTVPSNVLSQVRKYAIIHTTNPRDRWREWLRDTKEAVQLVRGVMKEFNQ